MELLIVSPLNCQNILKMGLGHKKVALNRNFFTIKFVCNIPKIILNLISCAEAVNMISDNIC